MKAFSYMTFKGEPGVGIDTDKGRFNFTYVWEIFKDIKNYPRASALNFLQIMVEMDYFSKETFDEVLETVQNFKSPQELRIKDDFFFDVPIARPQKILCLGRNYHAHAKEWKSTVPDQPMFFGKLPSALLAHEKQIRIPAGIGRVDHEIELAVVIGKKASAVSESKAMEHVAGYTIVNDVTARDMQGEDIKKGRPWTLAKGLDTFCPMGPYLVPADAITDPHNLEMELTVNGVTKQKANTRDMVFKIPELIAYISKYITLLPGDIICTGTPEGTLPIRAGDVLEANIAELGVLKNSVVEG
jgi:5-oxopent-3-ene-1,2,5-tricarboxylate decarboxylase/2-hydroxyhepta-2,4-diene-1,7-dioate isomerase